MGWLYMRDLGRFPTARAYLDDQFTYVRDDHRLTILRSAMVGRTYYAACERIEADDRREVFAIVCLTRQNSGARDGCTFGYKDMSEHMGPHESACPVAILDLLTPTDSDYALGWRSRCRAHHAATRLRNARARRRAPGRPSCSTSRCGSPMAASAIASRWSPIRVAAGRSTAIP